MKINQISARIPTAASSVFLIWFLTILFPAVFAVLVFDFYLEKHFEYAKIQAVSHAGSRIDQFDHSIVPENFLHDLMPEFKSILEQCGDLTPAKLCREIAERTQSVPIYAVFQDGKTKKLKQFQNKPEDIKSKTLPPATLLKRLFEDLNQKEKSNASAAEKRVAANKLVFQQMFKTLTTSTLLRNSVSRNFSTYLGGEIYFVILSLPESAKISNALLVFRGRELTSEIIYRRVRKNFPEIRITLKNLPVSNNGAMNIFNSGSSFTKDYLSVIKPANQLFARNFLHKGGVKIVRNPELVPFIESRTDIINIYSDLKPYRQSFVRVLQMAVLIISVFFFRIGLFGFDFTRSLKKRVMAAIMLTAIFPFSIMGASMYLYRNSANYISRLNLFQHLELSIAQNFEELQQMLTGLETYLISRPELLAELVNIGEKDFENFAARLGQNLPFSEANLIRENGALSHSIPERRGVFTMGSDDPVWSFFPTRALRLLQEDGRKNRSPQHMFDIAGQTAKASFVGDSLQTIGGFYLISQGAAPTWISTIQIADPEKQGAIVALLNLKFDLDPLLDSFFKQRRTSGKGLSEKVANYQIKYGFFPLIRLRNNQFWEGEFISDDLADFEPYLNINQSQTIGSADSDTGKIVMIRTNVGIPHKVIAIAEPVDGTQISDWWFFFIFCGSFMVIILVFSSQLLDLFFVFPVSRMAERAEKIARGDDEWPLIMQTGDELESLNRNFAAMVEGLKQRNVLKNYVSQAALNEIEESRNEELYPGGEYQEASVVFACIRDFETLVDGRPGHESMLILDLFFQDCDLACNANFGNVDKVIDNTVMMVFREKSVRHHSLRAALTILQIQKKLDERGLKIQAGLASGQVISGRIGSYSGKLDFTVIGDTVNLASRLKNEAFSSNTGMIVSGSAMRFLKGKARVSFLRRCSIKGKSREFNIYELNELR